MIRLIFLVIYIAFTMSKADALRPAVYNERVSLGASFTVNMFQQQVKPEIGDERGERLTFDYGLGLDIYGYYMINEYIEVGAFIRYDNGSNRAAMFDSISPTGTAVTSGTIEGDNNEFWIGPRLLIRYEGLFGEFGWGVWGMRNDESRTDIPDKNGNTDNALDLNPAFAMQINLGYELRLSKNWGAFAKLEWRLRYYDGRAGEPLFDEIEHGTMNLNPFIGINYRIRYLQKQNYKSDPFNDP
jgi:hypothetical protein